MTTAAIRVNLHERSYHIVVTSDDFAGLGPFARQRCRGTLAFLVADEHVQSHADAAARTLGVIGFRVGKAILRPGEQQKTLGSASLLYNYLADLQADRQTVVVAVGGGVIGALAGFVAAT